LKIAPYHDYQEIAVMSFQSEVSAFEFIYEVIRHAPGQRHDGERG
jgi:hypothetical protein